jgi:phosphate transport system substrate-binding protein
VNQLGSSPMVAESIGNSVGAIGYSGIGFQTDRVKAIGIAPERSGEPVQPSAKSVYNGSYPLTRFLYLIFNRPTGIAREAASSNISQTQLELLRFVLSGTGQEIVSLDGFVPLTPKMIEQIVRRYSLESR